MSLYGDLPQAKNSTSDAAGAGWPDPKLMAPASLKKPAAMAAPAFKPPPSVLRAAAAGGAGGPGRGGPARGIPITGRTGGRGPPNTLVVDGSGSDGARSLTPAATPGGGPAVASASAPAPGGPATAGPGPSGTALGGGSSIFARQDGRPIEDEYDPMRPNDYEEVIAARERARKAAEAEAERLAKQKEAEAEAERLRKQEEERARAAAAVLAAAAAPPGASAAAPGGAAPGGEAGGDAGGGVMSMEEYARRRAAMGMTGDDAFARRGRMAVAQAAEAALGAAGMGMGGGAGGGGAMGPPGSAIARPDEGGAAGGGAAGGPGSTKGMSLAQKLLEKMGWREGEGLGRNRQGISNPLMAQKTTQRAAVIVEAPSLPANKDQPDAKRPKGAQLTGAPSRVICMRNMVGPGQVDEELEEEVGQELTKYGKVLDVLIFEVTTAGYQEEEAVRIFVQFERAESATKAAVDLQGRFFAGRMVRVSFFPEERFTSTDLAPKAGEFD
ncbi:hypothetical protein CHLRE_11g467591v5 [Chlamydomonas reinhardtii]|uniref:G-patch domain-containing protein n=1 Tax=Chlamydomonas reinhardtii TaxID=3055 RepID=A0A2K3D7E0_CHLRE|nr:uncharacterized protein CHLRE_11g467591v5 [Chlamydomonas reinhardtii]PNW76444.1 hypothetical protein CHLRE_11g467591v5 [Chlamydomonas reinhardtii]